MNIKLEQSFGEITTQNQSLVMNIGNTINYKNFSKVPSVFLNMTSPKDITHFFTTPINVDRYVSAGTSKIIKNTICELILMANIFKDSKKEKLYSKALKELSKCKILENEKTIEINDLTIIPFVDTEDSYLLLIQSKSKTLLWTNYYKGGNLTLLIDRIKSKLGDKKIDYIVIDKNLSNNIEDKIKDLISNRKKIFLICHDKTIMKFFYNSATKNNIQCYAPWTMCQDLKTNNIQELIFKEPEVEHDITDYKKQREKMKDNFLIFIEESKLYKDLLKSFKGQDATIISINSNKDILTLGGELGFGIVKEEISNKCSQETISFIISKLQPKQIIN